MSQREWKCAAEAFGPAAPQWQLFKGTGPLARLTPRDRSLVTGRCSQCWGGTAAGSSLALPHRAGLLLVPAGGLADPTVLVPPWLGSAQLWGELPRVSRVFVQPYTPFVWGLFVHCSNQKCSTVFLCHAKLMQCRSFKTMQKWVTVSG